MPSALRGPEAYDQNRLITSGYIRKDLGDISAMTLWRMENDPDPTIRIPAPDLVVGRGRRKLWKLGTYLTWKERALSRGRITLCREPKRPRPSPPAVAGADA
jgi:hypothetical protein